MAKTLALPALLLGFMLTPVVPSATPTQSESSPLKPAPPAIEFDVVSIKVNRSGDTRMAHSFPANGDTMSFTNVPLMVIIFYVYNADRPGKTVGLPDWTKTERYDITAKVTGANVAPFQALDPVQRKLMLQKVLAYRFKLQIHSEKKVSPVYELVVAKNGSKMQPAQPSDIPANGRTVVYTGPGELAARAATTEDLAVALSDSPGMGRQIVDKTSLSGRYSFTLHFTMNQSADGAAGAAENGAMGDPPPSIFAAMQEQLGLKLQPASAPVDRLVIDHIERPSEN